MMKYWVNTPMPEEKFQNHRDINRKIYMKMLFVLNKELKTINATMKY